jgi:MerR family transcriptional regulator, light-induced transcriptional regulator
MDLREAAGALGVHYQTAYAWVREGVLPARKVGRGYEISEADARALAARRRLGAKPPRPIHVRDWAAQSRRLHEALANGDETLARQRADRLAGGVPVIDLCARVIGPALGRIGDDWAAGQASIAEEHRASAICERLIAGYARQPGGRPRGVAVATTPPGERHGLPALMAAACLREDHWLVHHLSADLPVAEVIRLAGHVGAALVVLSSATTAAVGLARSAAREITAAVPGVTVLTGRPGDSLYDLRAVAAGLPPRGLAPDDPEGSSR